MKREAYQEVYAWADRLADKYGLDVNSGTDQVTRRTGLHATDPTATLWRIYGVIETLYEIGVQLDSSRKVSDSPVFE